MSVTFELPDPIRKYLEGYPMFLVDEDISSSFVRTSPESFYYATRLIYESLAPSQIVWTTDNLSFAPNFAKYWVGEGLEHLRINYETACRGVEINRIFILPMNQYMNFGSQLDQLGMLHAKSGVIPHLAVYEKLPLHCRYDFAVWGDTYVDEVVYDLRSNCIVDNYIHWSSQKVKQFSQKLALVRNLIEPDWTVSAGRANSFDEVLEWSARIRQQIELPPDQERPYPNEVKTTEKSSVIRILFLAANPFDTTRLRLDEESRAIDEALRQATFRDRFDIRQHWAVRVSEIQTFLLRHKPDIVHLSGHGSESSEIVLEDNYGNSHPVSVRALSRLFSVLKDNIRCVVLNACYSEKQAETIAEHIDCVVGMSSAIGDAAAISFAAAFYQALGFGRDVKTAFDLGCVQIDLENLDEQDILKLLAKRSNPEDIVFVRDN